MMKTLPTPYGWSVKGCSSCVPYTVMASSSGCVMSTSHRASHQRLNSAVSPWMRETIHASTGAASVSRNSAWLSARWRVMLRMASPWSMKASRSGRVPPMAPHSAAFHTAVRRPITATPTAEPSAI